MGLGRSPRRRVATLSALTVTVLAVGVAAMVIRPGEAEVLPADDLESVDWTRATITLPSSGDQGCPAGKQRLRPGDAGDLPRIGKADNPGGRSLAILPGARSYGDLTGDGITEVVLPVWCSKHLAETFGESGAQLLAVGRNPDGSLVGLGYAGPVGAHYPDLRLGRHPFHTDRGPHHAAGARSGEAARRLTDAAAGASRRRR